MTLQCILVPQISSVPEHEARAQRVLRWLVRNRIVEALPTTCGQGGNGMAYAVAEGARRMVRHPERLPFGQRPGYDGRSAGLPAQGRGAAAGRGGPRRCP